MSFLGPSRADLPTAFYQHVVNIDFYVTTDLVAKVFIYKGLVGGSRILQAERYNLITGQPLGP